MVVERLQTSDVRDCRLNCSQHVPQALGCAARRYLYSYLKAARVDEKETTQGVVRKKLNEEI